MSTKRIGLKILAAVVAFGAMGFMVLATLSFTGDPISAAIARREAQSYIHQQGLSRMGLELSGAVYDFKSGGYRVRASSSYNTDLHFDIYWRYGKITRDTYEYDVLENGNVKNRFTDEFTALLQILLEQEGLGRDNLYVMLGENGENSDVWYPGMEFDPYLPVEKTLNLSPSLAEHTLQAAAEYMQKVCALMDEKGYAFAIYELYDSNDSGSIMLNRIPAEQVRRPDFLQWLIEQERLTSERDDAERKAMEAGEEYKSNWDLPMVSIHQKPDPSK